jgi:outer membrane protein OmpA-like peptidoglycan-associated protein
VSGTATAPNVPIVANSLRGTALALANLMSQAEPDAVPDVLRATVEVVAGGTAITPTTDANSNVIAVGPNRIEILASAANPARAWVSITAAGSINLVGSDTVTWETTPTPEQAATTAIDGQASYTATLLFQGGRSTSNPRFQHNEDTDFETAGDAARILPWIEFLKANSTVHAKLVGHADQSGTDGYNVTISTQRANFVRDFMIAQHPPLAAQLDPVEGKGESEPVAGHDHRTATTELAKRDAENRRVELRLVDPTLLNIVLIETTIPGTSAVWGPSRPAFPVAATGRLLAARNGTDAVTFTDGSFVGVGTHFFYINSLPGSPSAPNHTVTVGATAESAAQALAASILQNAQIDAYAEGRVVRLLPTGSHALIRLESTARNASANTLALEATGSLSRESAFSGGTDGGEPAAGNTIRLGTTTLTCRATAPAGANEFVKGTDAASTATNLATAISAVSGFSGSASGAEVRVTGPSGTALTTNNTAAFTLSAAQLSTSGSGTPPTVERREQNTTVAAGLSLDVAYSRRFGVDVTGNSRIATRLVSIPAPAELLDEIRTYLNGNPPAP